MPRYTIEFQKQHPMSRPRHPEPPPLAVTWLRCQPAELPREGDKISLRCQDGEERWFEVLKRYLYTQQDSRESAVCDFPAENGGKLVIRVLGT